MRARALAAAKARSGAKAGPRGGPKVAAAPVMPIPAPEVEPDVDSCSLSSEWECPVCYQLFCEPVLAACGRHTFCRNCLLRSQRCGAAPRCPVCRAEDARNAADIPEVAELVERLKGRDPHYDEKEAAARQEREEILQELYQARLVRSVWIQEARTVRTFEVCGAGTEEVNGVFVAGVLPTYVGPTVYRKPNTYLFIYRWHQTHWVIAELRGPYSMGDPREWLYFAPTQHPADLPPIRGWEIPSRGRACSPAPEVNLVRSGRPAIQNLQSERSRSGEQNSRSYTMAAAAAAAAGNRHPNMTGLELGARSDYRGAAEVGRERQGAEVAAAPSWAPGGDAQARCRCGPTCSLM